MSDPQTLLRQLPSVDKLLHLDAAAPLISQYSRPLVTKAVRHTLAETRARLQNGAAAFPGSEQLLQDAAAWLALLIRPTLRPVINATGVIIHTNLGRAPLSAAALQAIQEIAQGYSTLEYDLDTGQRGSRAVHAEKLLTRLTGAEAALVVNNNAAALLLLLSTLCQGKEVIISRGQLVEIGGGFRVPDVMAQSGARLVEVGTTNRTHWRDYANAITANTGAILVAHHSNFKIIGFTSEPSLAELAELAHQHTLPLLYDQGSGALLDTSPYGLDPEPTVTAGLEAGVDVVAFSGDKLLGGPQAGILAGRADLIAQLKKHPLARAVRADKLCLAGLAATLTHYLKDGATNHIPVWQMIAAPVEQLAERAAAWAAHLCQHNILAEVITGESTVGGGSLPGATLPTWLVAVKVGQVDQVAAALRQGNPSIIGRIAANQLLLDPRTVLPAQDTPLLDSLVALRDLVMPV
ncbi:MAG: L-seryl-tRNA(Sec) selenium transferase [Anaerolineae bacterium]|nr:L-seryl-tRNA(Sec) selenium transferase [Anaerolineae bacterium]